MANLSASCCTRCYKKMSLLVEALSQIVATRIKQQHRRQQYSELGSVKTQEITNA